MDRPIPIAIERHPYVPGRFTHLVRQGDARRRGWLVFGDTPWGVWRSRSAAHQAARRLEARGLVTVRSAKT